MRCREWLSTNSHLYGKMELATLITQLLRQGLCCCWYFDPIAGRGVYRQGRRSLYPTDR